MIIGGEATLTKSLLMATASGAAGDENLLIDAESLIGESKSASSSSGSIATDSTGVKATLTFEHRVPQDITIAPDVFVRLLYEIAVASLGTPNGRINIDIQKDGGSIATLSKALGDARDWDDTAGTQYEEFFRVQIPSTTFAAGETLDILVEFEVTTASGSGGSTATLTLHHDPATLSKQAIVEVNV